MSDPKHGEIIAEFEPVPTSNVQYVAQWLRWPSASLPRGRWLPITLNESAVPDRDGRHYALAPDAEAVSGWAKDYANRYAVRTRVKTLLPPKTFQSLFDEEDER